MEAGRSWSGRGGTLTLTRKVFVPSDAGFARFLEIVENRGATPVTVELKVTTDLGSDGSTQLVTTSSGDASFTIQDDFLITDDDDGEAIRPSSTCSRTISRTPNRVLCRRPRRGAIP